MSKLTLSFKGKVLKSFPISEGSMVLGSNSNCDIAIDSLAFEIEHAQINTHNGESTIRDLNTTNGTFINESKIDIPQILQTDDVIRIGKHTLSYTFSEQENNSSTKRENDPDAETLEQMQKPPKNQGWLQIMNGSNLGKTISLNKSMTNLGKPGVSTAVITKRNDGYFISQLEGNHPLLIKEQELGEKSQLLTDGDTIQIGNIKMQFYLE